ncbi:Ammecr1l [Symbiodinium microadriaticum]|nr:Ammecr1l [Symbiodinium microadriaticum]
MGLVGPAAAVLRQGLLVCPDSAVLKALAAKEGVELPEVDPSTEHSPSNETPDEANEPKAAPASAVTGANAASGI